jgi:hypothetical protein
VKTHYSCAELATLQLSGLLATPQGWKNLVQRESWPYAEEKSRGRGGLKRLYTPSEAVLKQIRRQETLAAPAAGVTAPHTEPMPRGSTEIGRLGHPLRQARGR